MRTSFTRVAVAAVLLAGSSAQAMDAWSGSSQDGFRLKQTMWIVNWEVAGPIGDFKNYISDWSLRGWSIEGRYQLVERLSIGTSFSYNRWNETFSNVSVPIQNGTASGPVYRYEDMFAIRFIAHYYLMDGPIQPYVGGGIGGVWDYAYQQVADLANYNNAFNFIVDPEVGVLWTLTPRSVPSLALNVAFRYTFTTANPGRTKDAQTIGPVVGLGWYY